MKLLLCKDNSTLTWFGNPYFLYDTLKKTAKPSKTCKLLIVGHPKCGKSVSACILFHLKCHSVGGQSSDLTGSVQSIIRRFVENNFEPRYCTTIGADYVRKDMTVSSGDCVRMQLWDIAGTDNAGQGNV